MITWSQCPTVHTEQGTMSVPQHTAASHQETSGLNHLGPEPSSGLNHLGPEPSSGLNHLGPEPSSGLNHLGPEPSSGLNHRGFCSQQDRTDPNEGQHNTLLC